MRILCIGISHKTAGVALREQLAFDPAAAQRGLAQLDGNWPQAEAVILATCNRAEVYVARPLHGHPRDHELHQWLADFHQLPLGSFVESLYTLTDAEAVKHLFEVAAGLDSLVVGESQITSQVKEAYALASQAGAARATMNLLFQTALGAAKAIRAEAGLEVSGRSVASLAIQCAARTLGQLTGKSVLNIGAGKMNELMIRRLTELGADQILVANRSPARASRMADRFAGKAVDFAALPQHLADADVVLTSTASDAPIVTRAMVGQAMQHRDNRPLLIVDIAVPRDVEPEVADIRGVKLYDIDDLEGRVAAETSKPSEWRDAAEQLIDRSVADVLQRLKIRQVAPTIDAMYRFMRAIADAELASAVNKLATHDDIDADRVILQRALRRTIRRILHPAVHNLRKASASDAAAAHVAALRKLFNLDDSDT